MLNFTGVLADVKIHFSRGAADVAEIRVRHLAGTIHDAAHDGDLHALEMRSGRFDFRGRRLEIEERPSATWAGDIVRLEDPGAGCLENVVSEPQ